MITTESVACPACSSRWSALRTAERHISWCSCCGTGVTVPAPERDVYGDELFDPATGRYADRVRDREQWFREAGRRLDWLDGLHGHGRLLELGPATGEFVASAELAGWDVAGLETSAWAAEQATQVTDRVQRGDLSSWRKQHPDETVDAVAMFHVLEHVADPESLLSEIAAVLRPGGVLVLEVPNGDSPGAKPDGRTWWAASLDDHFHHHTAPGLGQLLKCTGFRDVVTTPLPLQIYAPVVWRARAHDAVRRRAVRPVRDLLRLSAHRS